MDFLSKLNADLDKGFSKTQLEKCIGLPRNSLAGVISGKKKLSKISSLKIEAWEKSNKPSPLSLIAPRQKSSVTYLNEKTNVVEPKKAKGVKKSNFTVNTNIPPMPTRNEGEDAFSYAARKNEWKLKHNN